MTEAPVPEEPPVPYQRYVEQLEAIAEEQRDHAATKADLKIVRQQRDFLGDQLRRRIERHHGLRVAHGDIDAATMAGLCQQEVGVLQAHVAGMERKEA